MIKREIVMKMVQESETRQKEEIAKIKEKLAGLRKAVTDLVATTPEDLWTLPELGKALKQLKIVCLTTKKFAEESLCDSCHKECDAPEEYNPPACECEKTPNLCEVCMVFLFEAIQLMGAEKEIDVFGMGNVMLIGMHIER